MLQHRSTVEVRFYELDPYNHVNHTNYLAYCEVARVRALEEAGIGLVALAEKGFHIVVTDIAAKFLRPAVANDVLDITTRLIAVGRASHQWEQAIERRGETIFTLSVRAAMTDLDGTPVRVPDFVRSALEA